MNDKNGWISKTGWTGNGVEGIRTGGVSQSTGDWIEVIGGLITNTAVGEG